MNESRLDGFIEKSNLAQTFWKIVVKHRKDHGQHNHWAKEWRKKMVKKIIVAHNGIIWSDGHSIIRDNLRFERRVLLVDNTVDCPIIRNFEIEKLNIFDELL